MKKKLTILGIRKPIAIEKALITMKLILLLIIAGVLQASANVNGQNKVSLKLNNIQINQALNSIEKQTNYRFLYNNQLKNLQQKISIELDNADIGEALTKILSGSDLTYKMLENNLIVILSATLTLQDIRITGKITGDNGEALSGVSVTIKGTSRGTTSNNNGEFELTVPENGTLVISYIGYQSQEIAINSQSVINIKLSQSNKPLDQVVVVGYGTQRRRDVTGATATVSGAELVKQPVLTATQAIQGKVAGVQIISSGQPGSQPSVRIRGTGSILGGAEPLYVVDGIITSDITNINNADILSVDILKDASSAAIYGSRGANGVIIITTKQGSSKMQITYNGNVGIQSAEHLVKMANSTQYAKYISDASYGLNTITPTGYSTDWYSLILRTAVQQNHGLSISGSSEKVKYLFNASYSDNQGIIIDNYYKRFTLRSNTEFKLANNLKFSILGSYTNGINRNVNLGTAYNDAYRAAPIVPGEVNGKYGNTSLYQNVGNPLLDINSLYSKTVDNRLNGNASLEFKPISMLTLKSSIGADWDNSENTIYNYAFAADSSTFIKPGGNQSNLISGLTLNSANSLHWFWDNTATLSKRINDHNFSLLGGFSLEKYSSTWFNASGKGVPPESNLWNLDNINQSYAPSVSGNSFPGTPLHRISYFGRLNYSYLERYLLTVNFRADGSSNFPQNNRWGYFPSVGVGWIISQEGFMQNQKIFDMLKIRGSWGKVGNDITEAGSAAYSTILLTGLPYFFNGVANVGSIPSAIKDKNLKWEVVDESDVAVEFALLHSRLSGEFSYYQKVTNNSLIYVAVPGTLGSFNSSGNAQYVLTNAASVQNKGIEMALNWRDKISSKLGYTIGGNITFNKNNVTGLNGGQAYIDGSVSSSQPYVTKTDIGHPIGSFYVQQMTGVVQSGGFAGNPIYHTNKSGIVDSAYQGSYQPKFYYGLNLGLTYGNFDLTIGGYGTYGGKIYNAKKAARNTGLDNIESSVANAYWTSSNLTNTTPAASFFSTPGSTSASSYFIESGSFFRINNLNLGFNVPATALSHTKVIQSLRIYVSVQNLVTITKYTGFSPEIQSLVSPYASNTGVPSNTSATSAGVDLNAYPTPRTIIAGINLGF